MSQKSSLWFPSCIAKHISQECHNFNFSYFHMELESGLIIKNISTGADPKILKKGMLYDGHHGWLTKKILGFRCPKRAKTTLETKAFGKTFVSVFSNFLHFYI